MLHETFDYVFRQAMKSLMCGAIFTHNELDDELGDGWHFRTQSDIQEALAQPSESDVDTSGAVFFSLSHTFPPRCLPGGSPCT